MSRDEFLRLILSALAFARVLLGRLPRIGPAIDLLILIFTEYGPAIWDMVKGNPRLTRDVQRDADVREEDKALVKFIDQTYKQSGLAQRIKKAPRGKAGQAA